MPEDPEGKKGTVRRMSTGTRLSSLRGQDAAGGTTCDSARRLVGRFIAVVAQERGRFHTPLAIRSPLHRPSVVSTTRRSRRIISGTLTCSRLARASRSPYRVAVIVTLTGIDGSSALSGLRPPSCRRRHVGHAAPVDLRTRERPNLIQRFVLVDQPLAECVHLRLVLRIPFDSVHLVYRRWLLRHGISTDPSHEERQPPKKRDLIGGQ